MDLAQLISAILAGGLAGQLTTLILGYRYSSRREYLNWRRAERFKVFSELLSSVSSAATREEFETWPDEIRVLSQKAHLLFEGGTAPNPIEESLQTLFRLALDRKLDSVKDIAEWRKSMRTESRKLRSGLAEALH